MSLRNRILFEQNENFSAKASKNISYEKVYKLVSRIPKGKVTTYGAIAKKLHMSPRTVGTSLHLNPYEGEVPYHKVVNRDGRIAPGFAFGGIGTQRNFLEKEGVKFKDEIHVNPKSIVTNSFS